jgi:hypothetical protein
MIQMGSPPKVVDYASLRPRLLKEIVKGYPALKTSRQPAKRSSQEVTDAGSRVISLPPLHPDRSTSQDDHRVTSDRSLPSLDQVLVKFIQALLSPGKFKFHRL